MSGKSLGAILALLFLALTACGVAGEKNIFPAEAFPLEGAIGQYRFQVSPSLNTTYFGNADVTRPNLSAKRVIIVIYGMNHNAKEYGETIVKSASLAGELESTMVIAPLFKTEADKPDPGELAWTDSGWKIGNKSTAPSSSDTSSFLVVDKLLSRLADKSHFPSIHSIVVAGHSAGGQFVARYSLGTPLADFASVKPRFIIVNPSSYMFLNGYRPNGAGSYVTPSSCNTYNDYRYGLRDRNSYMNSSLNVAELPSRLKRDIHILLGQRDTTSEDLDEGCEANIQGKNRLERGRNFFAHTKHYFAGAALNLSEVPGVGHNSSEIFQSKTGIRLLFP